MNDMRGKDEKKKRAKKNKETPKKMYGYYRDVDDDDYRRMRENQHLHALIQENGIFHNLAKVRMYIRLNKLDEAEKMITKCVDELIVDKKAKERYPELVAEALNDRGRLRFMRNEPERAIEDYRLALNHVYRHPESWFNRGEAYLKLGNFKLAIDDLQNVLKLEPMHINARELLQQAINSWDEERKTQPDYKPLEIKIPPLPVEWKPPSEDSPLAFVWKK